MMLTFDQVKEELSSEVGSGGVCPDSALVLSRVNEAIRRLLRKGDWTQTLRSVRFFTQYGTIALPRCIEAIRYLGVNSVPAHAFSQSYEFVDGGFGGEYHLCSPGDLKDLGVHPTFFDPPPHDDTENDYGDTKLFLVGSDSAAITARIFGFDTSHCEIRTSGVPGEDLVAARWANGVEGALTAKPTPLSTNYFTQITQIILPAGRTTSYCLYSVNPTTDQMYFLSKYSPDEENPAYRRYQVIGADTETVQSIQTLCKVKYWPMTLGTDVLLIQNVDAIKAMLRALRFENAENEEKAVYWEAKAVQMLNEQKSDHHKGETPIIRVQDYLHAWDNADFH